MSGIQRKGCTGNQPRKSRPIHRPHFRYPENESEATSSYCTIKILQLEKDKERQQTEMKGLQTHIKELKPLLEQLNKLKNDNNCLRTSNEKLKKENKDLRMSEELEKENMDLRMSNEELEKENKDLRMSNKELENENKDLKMSNEELENENKDLRTSNENLNQQISWLREQLEELKNRIAQLEEENLQLISRLDELKKETINKKEIINKKELIKKKEMILAELKAKVDKDIIARMDKYSTRMQSVISIIVHASDVIKKRNAKQLEDEEESYKFTNAFTSAGEGSVLDISKRYRHLQHNMRASAVRASKKIYKIPSKRLFCSQTLNAYEVAKNVLLEESGRCIYMHLIKLQPSGEEFNDKMLKACMRIVDYVATDEVANDAIKRITEELKLKDAEERAETAKNDSLPPDVANYYHTLAELTWQAISRPIPMVYEMEEQVYKKDYHDLKDGESDDEGKAVVYIYPVLYSSNQWPRQIAQMGRVELDE